MSVATAMNLWTVAGLVYALAGVTLLSMALFAEARPGSIPEEMTSAAALRRQIRQWLDQRIGAVLLVIGFFLQATGALGTTTLNGAGAIVLLGLAFSTAAYAMLRDTFVEGLVASHPVDHAAAPVLAHPQQAVRSASPTVVAVEIVD